MMHFKLKTLAVAVLLLFFCPLAVNDSIDCSTINAHQKHVKKQQIKIKRSIVRTVNCFSKYGKTTGDAGSAVELHQIADYGTDYFPCYSASTAFIPPVIKHAVWSRSTFC